MSIFKKICSLLFEETETEVIAEDELETISFKGTKPEKKEVEEKIQLQREQPKPVIKTEVVQQAKPQQESEDTKKKFVSINLDEKPAEPVVVKKEVPKATTVKKSVLKEKEKDYEYSPVISPMFGAKEEQKKPVRKESPSIMKKTTKKPNPLGTIISPYFGLKELEEFEEEAKEEIATKAKEKQASVTPPVNEVELHQFELQEEKEIHNVSLDELLSEEHIGEVEDDVMQISLFGESAPIRQDDTISFKINDKEQ